MTKKENWDEVKKKARYLKKNTTLSNKEIAKECECHMDTINKWFRKWGLSKGHYRKYSLEFIDKIAEMYQTKSCRQIAVELGLTFYMVASLIHYYGITKGEYSE